MNRMLSPAEKAAKQEKRAVEGAANMARYLEHQQATLEKTARLRALRLARVSKPDQDQKHPGKSKEDAEHQPLTGLHNGTRG
jgi:hypothetical protein